MKRVICTLIALLGLVLGLTVSVASAATRSGGSGWSGFTYIQPMNYVETTMTIEPATGGTTPFMAPWVGISTSGGGLVQTGYFIDGANDVTPWWTDCPVNGIQYNGCYAVSLPSQDTAYVGDTIKIAVNYTAYHTYRTSFEDITRNWTFWKTNISYDAAPSQVEWINEQQPQSAGGSAQYVGDWPDFTTIHFTDFGFTPNTAYVWQLYSNGDNGCSNPVSNWGVAFEAGVTCT